jgi:hypothetical protein
MAHAKALTSTVCAQVARTACGLEAASTARASALRCRDRCRERDPMASTGCSPAGDAYPSEDVAPDVSEVELDRSPPDSGYVDRECSADRCSSVPDCRDLK